MTTTQPFPSLEQLGGSKQNLSGQTPVLLDQPNQLWLVLTGLVDIFAVSLQDGQLAGTRSHLLRVAAGEIIPQFFKSNLMGFLAVGVIGTEILKVSSLALAKQSPPTVAALLDNWIINLSSTLAGTDLGWAEYVAKPGSEVSVPTHAMVCGEHRQVVWVTVAEGEMRYLDEIPLASTDGWLPLTDRTWLRAMAPARLIGINTITSLEQGQLWSALSHFHSLAVTARLQAIQQAAAERLARKELARQQALDFAYHSLAAVFRPAQTFLFSHKGSREPLLVALQLVGEATGVKVTSLPTVATDIEGIIQIANASRLRWRRVTLADDWWQRDNGPLLGFLGTRPVALLPRSPQRYEMVDPVTQIRQVVTATLAKQLSPQAVMLYRSFAPSPLTLFKIFRFGRYGTSQDLIRVLWISLLVSLLALVSPIASGMLFESIIPRAERLQLVHLVAALGMVALGTALFNLTKAFALLRLEGKFDWSIQAAVWDRLLSLPIPFFKNYTAGDLANRTLSINTIRQTLTGTTITSLLAALFSITSLTLLFYYNRILALTALLLASVAMTITFWLSYLQLAQQRLMLEQQGRIEGLVFQLILGIAKLRVAASEPRALAVWARRFAEAKASFVKANTYENVLVVFHATFPILASVIFFVMITQVISGMGEFSTGDFIAFNNAFGQFLTAMNSMTQVLTSTLMVIPLWERVQPILSTPPENTADKHPPGELKGHLEISRVTFRYLAGGPAILDELSLSIQAGQLVAIVGASGSGKSTLFRLLLGFEIPEKGAIYYDGKDLAMLDTTAVRRQIGVVLQQGKITAGSLFENIVGNSPRTQEDAWRAARLVGLDKDIEAMPMGMHTVLMEGATTLSGGQKQRLMLARALVHQPRLLLLDEATSSLDNQTQAMVIENLLKLNVTRIVIAHRLSTITQVDKILVFERGRIVQAGSFAELVAQEGPFANLAKRQIL